MAHSRGYVTNSSKVSVESGSSLSLSVDVENVRKNSSLSGEVDKLLSELKCKRTFQDEDSLDGPATSLYSTPQVSRLIALICGVEKKELKADTRQTLKLLEGFFKELILDTNISNGIKVKEGLKDLFHNPEHLVFQNLLSNEPADWAKLVLSILLDVQRKKVVREEVGKDIQDFQVKRRELAKDIGLVKKRLGELQGGRAEKEDKMQADNMRRLTIALDSDKADADKVEEQLSKHGKVITNSEVGDLVTKYAQLKSCRDDRQKELEEISAGGILPPHLGDAIQTVETKKSYLESLKHQISNPLDESQSSFNNSVFRRKSSH